MDAFDDAIARSLFANFSHLRFETFLPDSLHTIAEVIQDMTALNTTTCGQETTDNASDMSADVKRFGIIDTDALNTQAETSDAREDDCLTFG